MERIQLKISRIEENLAIVRSIKDDCFEKFSNDPIYRGALLHYLFIISDSCIALAELVIKNKKLKTPQYYADAIDILGESGIIEPEFAYHFAKIAGFRNFLAHDYEKIDKMILCGEIINKLADVKEYIRQIKKSLGL
jgi:uncharacterized protein YutE (UPF0331/DUF86 family)